MKWLTWTGKQRERSTREKLSKSCYVFRKKQAQFKVNSISLIINSRPGYIMMLHYITSPLLSHLLRGTIKRVYENLIKGKVKSYSLINVTFIKKKNKKCYRLRFIGGLTTRPDPVVLTSSVGVLLSGDPSYGDGKDGGVVSSFWGSSCWSVCGRDTRCRRLLQIGLPSCLTIT